MARQYGSLPNGKYRIFKDNEEKYGIETEKGEILLCGNYPGIQIIEDRYVFLYDENEKIYDLEKRRFVDEDCLWKAINVADGYILAVNDNKEYGIVDSESNIVVPFGKYKMCGSCNGSFLVQGQNDKHGLISANGDIIIPTEYDEIEITDGRTIHHFSEIKYKWYPVRVGKKWYYADKNGILLDPGLELKRAYMFNNAGMAIVVGLDSQSFVIDTEGKVVFDMQYYGLEWLNDECLLYKATKKMKKTGICNIYGDCILACDFNLQAMYGGYFKVLINRQRYLQRNAIFKIDGNKVIQVTHFYWGDIQFLGKDRILIQNLESGKYDSYDSDGNCTPGVCDFFQY